MPDTPQLLMFIAAGWLLNLTPGPDVLYVASHSLRSGVRAGVVASLGITAGCCVHVLAAALGVGALLAASATAFGVLKWVGALYLCYLGIRLLRTRAGGSPLAAQVAMSGDGGAQAAPGVPLRRVFLGGLGTNVLNPKVVLFFLAFLPQFIAPGTARPALAFLMLGLLFSLNALLVNCGWALALAWASRRVAALQRGMHWLDRAAGALFVGFGVKLTLTDQP